MAVRAFHILCVRLRVRFADAGRQADRTLRGGPGVLQRCLRARGGRPVFLISRSRASRSATGIRVVVRVDFAGSQEAAVTVPAISTNAACTTAPLG